MVVSLPPWVRGAPKPSIVRAAVAKVAANVLIAGNFGGYNVDSVAFPFASNVTTPSILRMLYGYSKPGIARIHWEEMFTTIDLRSFDLSIGPGTPSIAITTPSAFTAGVLGPYPFGVPGTVYVKLAAYGESGYATPEISPIGDAVAHVYLQEPW